MTVLQKKLLDGVEMNRLLIEHKGGTGGFPK